MLKDIQGHQNIAEFLLRGLVRQRTASAYLFLGPQGVGKTTLALNFSKLLNCQDPLKKGNKIVDCCEVCASCRKINNSNHPDARIVAPQKRGAIIRIEAIREMQKDLSLKPFESKRKIFIVENADCMGEDAANCFLKTLEEPPMYALLILTATNLFKLLPTIISRCQILRFGVLSAENIKGFLARRYNLPHTKLHSLSLLAQGSIGKALEMLETDFLSTRDDLVEKFTNLKRASLLEDFISAQNKPAVVRQIEILITWVRDLLLAKENLTDQLFINLDRIKDLRDRSQDYSKSYLQMVLEELLRTKRLLEYNVNLRLTLDNLAYNIVRG